MKRQKEVSVQFADITAKEILTSHAMWEVGWRLPLCLSGYMTTAAFVSVRVFVLCVLCVLFLVFCVRVNPFFIGGGVERREKG